MVPGTEPGDAARLARTLSLRMQARTGFPGVTSSPSPATPRTVTRSFSATSTYSVPATGPIMRDSSTFMPKNRATKALAGRWKTSRAGPAVSILPWFISTTVSARPNASA